MMYATPQSPVLSTYCRCLESQLTIFRQIRGIDRTKEAAFIAEISHGTPKDHTALRDAIHQGHCYMSLRKLSQPATHKCESN